MEVMGAIKNLKRTNISINYDYLKEIRKKLIKHLTEPRTKGYLAKLVYDMLYINGEDYRMNQIEQKQLISKKKKIFLL